MLAAYAIGTALGTGAAIIEPDERTVGEIAVHGLAIETAISLTYQGLAYNLLSQIAGSSAAAIVVSGTLDVTLAFTIGFNTGYFLSKGLESGVEWSTEQVLELWK